MPVPVLISSYSTSLIEEIFLEDYYFIKSVFPSFIRLKGSLIYPKIFFLCLAIY